MSRGRLGFLFAIAWALTLLGYARAEAADSVTLGPAVHFDRPRSDVRQAQVGQLPQNPIEQAKRLARLQECELMVNAFKEARLLPEHLARLNEGKARQAELAKWRKLPDVKQQLAEKVDRFVEAHKQFLPEIKRIHQWLNHPQNKAAVEDLFGAETLCKTAPADIEAKLVRHGLKPSAPGAGNAPGKHFFIGLSKGVSGAVGLGLVAGRQIVTDFRGTTMSLVSIGPAIVSNVALSVTVEVMFYPSTTRDAFVGWSAGLGASGGTPAMEIGGALDFAFGSTPAVLGSGFMKEFQGFGLGPTAGVSALPVDGTNSYAHTWQLPWWVP